MKGHVVDQKLLDNLNRTALEINEAGYDYIWHKMSANKARIIAIKAAAELLIAELQNVFPGEE